MGEEDLTRAGVDGPIEPEILNTIDDTEGDSAEKVDESIEQPAKVIRVGTMMKQLLDEVRAATLDEASRDRLKEIYETSVTELGSALSADLREELGRLALPFDDDVAPSNDELRIAQAQLVGWLEGLIQGIQAALFAQKMAAQQQHAGIRRSELGPGRLTSGGPPPEPDVRPGTYL